MIYLLVILNKLRVVHRKIKAASRGPCRTTTTSDFLFGNEKR